MTTIPTRIPNPPHHYHYPLLRPAPTPRLHHNVNHIMLKSTPPPPPSPSSTSTSNTRGSYLRTLPAPRRLQFGLFLLAWGGVGLYLVEPVEKTLDLEYSPSAAEELKSKYGVRVRGVEKAEVPKEVVWGKDS